MGTSKPSSRATTLTGTVAGRFVILRLLGAGGMGQVYQAQDTKLKRVVAIKRMAPKLQQDERDRRRFLREAQQASALNHPNIAAIYDVIVPYGRDRLRFQLRHPEDTPPRCRLQPTPHHRRERPIHLRPVATALRGPIPRSSFSSSREFHLTMTDSQIPGVNTPVSIPSNGTMTFQIPAASQGTFAYSVDGCQ